MLIINIKARLNNYWYIISILVIGLIVTLPQIMSQSTIIGADGLFHFNRFYDVAMQIKHHNFSYFMQLYGFLGSGRIVTAIYSPFVTYFLGGILFLCDSFYKFEIVTRFLLFILAGISMNYALKMANIKNKFFVQLVSTLYAFSPAIIRWDVAQNFTSVGAILLPLVVGCGIRMIDDKDKPINWFQLGMIMAITVQTHLATAIQATFILFVYAISALIMNPHARKQLIKNVIYAVLFCITLSLNILAGMFELYNGNDIVPIIKFDFSDGKGVYDLFQLYSGKWVNLFFIIIVALTLIVTFKRMMQSMRVTGILSLILFISSTSIIFDWATIMNFSPMFSSLLQFPSRMVVPATVLAFFVAASVGEQSQAKSYLKLFSVGIAVLLSMFLLINMRSNFRYNRIVSQRILVSPSTTIPFVERSPKLLQQVEKSMRAPLNKESMQIITKSTSDYMPATKKLENADYNDYQRKIIVPIKESIYQKTIKHHKVVVTWKGNGTYDNVPVAYYQNSQFKLNGEKITPEAARGNIKVPRVKGRNGKNRLEVKYKPDLLSQMALDLSIVAWTGVFIYLIFDSFRKIYRKLKR